MGFYFRKSVSIGPLRLNLSTGGIGASVGVKGLRVGVGPSGTYVHAGLGGLYYRSSLNARPRVASTSPPRQSTDRLREELEAAQPSTWEEIDSGSVDLMVDSSAETVIEQLKSRNEGTYWLVGILAIGLVSCLIALSQGGFSNPRFSWNATSVAWAAFLGLAAVGTIAGAIWGYRRDAITRGGVAFLYDLDGPMQAACERLYNALDNVARSSVKYLLTSSAHVDSSQARYHAGVNTLVKTSALVLNLDAPGRVIANVPIPCVNVGTQMLCFFPERLIVLQGSGSSERIGAIPYSQLRIDAESHGFTLNTEVAPPGTQPLDHTWQYVNKNGSPDRRFKNNRRLARIRSETITFKSATGLNEAVMTSTPGLGSELAGAIGHLAILISQGAGSTPRSREATRSMNHTDVPQRQPG